VHFLAQIVLGRPRPYWRILSLHRVYFFLVNEESPWQDLHLHLSVLKTDASAVGLHGDSLERKEEGMLPRPESLVCFRNSAGSLVRFTFPSYLKLMVRLFLKKLPSLLCGLGSRGSMGMRGRSCTCDVYLEGTVLQTVATHLAVASRILFAPVYPKVLPAGFAPAPRPHLGLTDHKSAVLLLHHGRKKPPWGLAPHSADYESAASLSMLRRHCLRKAEGMLPNPKRIDPLSRRSWRACPVNFPEERPPGLAPGKNWFAASRLVFFGMGRFLSRKNNCKPDFVWVRPSPIIYLEGRLNVSSSPPVGVRR
jgi:hypothetical protein